MILEVPASAGMLFPGPEKITLCGVPYRAMELRVRHVARLERMARIVAGHPFHGLGDELEAASDTSSLSEEKVDILSRLWQAEESWPPRLGSAIFSRALGGRSVAPTYLGLALRVTRPRLTVAHAQWLAESLSGDEWGQVDRIAWGNSPICEGGGSICGLDWGKCLDFLVEKRGMTPDAIGNLHLSPFYRLVTGKGSYLMELPDLVPPDITSGPGTGRVPSGHSI